MRRALLAVALAGVLAAFAGVSPASEVRAENGQGDVAIGWSSDGNYPAWATDKGTVSSAAPFVTVAGTRGRLPRLSSVAASSGAWVPGRDELVLVTCGRAFEGG